MGFFSNWQNVICWVLLYKWRTIASKNPHQNVFHLKNTEFESVQITKQLNESPPFLNIKSRWAVSIIILHLSYLSNYMFTIQRGNNSCYEGIFLANNRTNRSFTMFHWFLLDFPLYADFSSQAVRCVQFLLHLACN